MEKSTAGLVGAIASLATMGTAQAAHPVQTPAHLMPQVMSVSSYAELLQPIPNAPDLLKASNAELLQKSEAQARVQEVQYYNQGPPPGYYDQQQQYHHHHHHHHHHAYYPPPPPPPDYHHHHHHNGVTIVIPGLGVLRNGG
jgi:hypothetical protein